MTLATFLEHLAVHERGKGWYVTATIVGAHGAIRRKRLGAGGACPVCPLSSLNNDGVWGASAAARRFGICDADVVAITDAADRRPRHDRTLRARLCAALGLEDITPAGTHRHGGPNQ